MASRRAALIHLRQSNPEGRHSQFPAILWAATVVLTLASPSCLDAQQDCNTGIPVCQNIYVQNNSFQGTGAILEAAATCLAGESSSVWYIFTAQTTGSFAFTLNTALDYDFALYNITIGGCAGIANATPIRCNFSATNGNTGLTLPAQGETPALSIAAGGVPTMPGINVTAGQTYALLVNNFNNNTNGYTLTFSGGATIADTTPPTIISLGLDRARCLITLTSSEPILCSSIAADGSDFQMTAPSGGGVNVISAAGVGCGAFTNQISLGLSLSQPETCGFWNIRPRAGTDGNTLTDICGNPLVPRRGGLPVPRQESAVPSLALPAVLFCEGSPIVADGSASSREINHFWSVVETDRNGTVIGRECSSWFSGEAKTLDIRKFAAESCGLQLQCGRSYRVKLAVQNCCTGWSETVEPIVIACAPRANAGPDQSLCCGRGSAMLEAPVFPGFYSYAWTAPDGTNVSGRRRTSVAPSQTTTYTLQVTDRFSGCSSTDDVTVNVFCKQPQVSLAVGPTSCCSASRTITANVTDASSVHWLPGGETTNQITVAPTSTTTYTAIAKNSCFSSSASVTVQPKVPLTGKFPTLIHPASFTPNGDGKNEVFTIYHFGVAEGHAPAYNATRYELNVFSRNETFVVAKGESCDGFPNGAIQWDGRINGRVVPEGVYSWMLFLENCDQASWTQKHRKARYVCKEYGFDLASCFCCGCQACVRWGLEEYEETRDVEAVTVYFPNR
ncbi:MAG TPA: gliding motility-associated C-terminal domain-containing protein [Thermoanaerobaculia bacterium]|jgi:hypothetical protein|nr:gliding motility-associated C-terminal domain-containing protein [Thermoanaerobaculia bacterium]